MAGELQGKRTLVTGASRGIGRAVTERLHAQGAGVISVARALLFGERFTAIRYRDVLIDPGSDPEVPDRPVRVGGKQAIGDVG